MGLTEILNEKKRQAESLKTKYKLLKKNKILWVVSIDNKEHLSYLLDWLSVLPLDLIVLTNEPFKDYPNIIYQDSIEDELLLGIDFIICDTCLNNVEKYLKKWVVPIVSKDCYLNKVLNDFNPVKSEWNAFFYDKINPWSIFYSVVRYLENHKFPYDNRNLVKNVLDIYY